MRKYELSISADYVPGWGVTEAVREFFQNSIDEETRDSSNKMLFEYDEAEEKLIIGINIASWILRHCCLERPLKMMMMP